MQHRVLIHLLALSFAVPASLAGSSTFDLGGTVLDDTGSALSGATLTLTSAESGTERSTTTNEAGRYTFSALPPGEYSLEVGLAGFATSRYEGLRYFADTTNVFNVTLKSRDVQESVTFTGEAPLINMSLAQVGLSVEERQLEELPLTRREYLELVTLAGSVDDSDERSPAEPARAPRGPSINGNDARYTAYRLDGFNNTRDQHGVSKIAVSLEAVEEFRVITGQSSAEYGQNLGGLVSATTPSGGVEFHGSVFAHIRPGSWDSSDPLTGQSVPLERQDLGFTLSGPIGDQGTHFFTSFEYRNEDETVVVTAPFDEGRFRGTFELPSRHAQFLFKLSQPLGDRHNFLARVIVNDRSSTEKVGGFDILENAQDTDENEWAVQATLTSSFGGTLSELRAGFIRENFGYTSVAPPLGEALLHPTRGNIGNPNRLYRADEDQWQLSETLSFSRGDHRMKAGVNLYGVDTDTEIESFLDGAFLFAPDTTALDAISGSPGIILFQRSFVNGRNRASYRETHIQTFFQDDLHLSPYFTLNLGLRWEKETSVPDSNNFAPRLGFHWDATRDGRTAVRGGYGIFYTFVFSLVDSYERLFGPEGLRVHVSDGSTVVDFLSNPPPANLYVEAPIFSPSNRRTPYAQHVTAGVERELLSGASVSVDLSYIRGESLILPEELNAPSPFDYSSGGNRTMAEADATRPFGVPGQPIAPGESGSLPDGYPFGGYRDLYLLSSRGTSEFWGLKLVYTQRAWEVLKWQAMYQWSRTENDGDDFRPERSIPLNPLEAEAERGRGRYDIPHRLVVNGILDGPWGLRVGSVLRARSGRVVDPRVRLDLDGDGKLRERASRPGAVLSRNSFRARSWFSLDFSFAKVFELAEGRHVEASLEVFNITNRLNPLQVLDAYGPDAGAPIPSFLEIVQAAPPRQFQVSVRFRF